jgi:hypothetical protein
MKKHDSAVGALVHLRSVLVRIFQTGLQHLGLMPPEWLC